MTKEQAEKRIKELSTIIDQHNYNYYVASNPVISDYEFDMLLEELIHLEKEFPELQRPDSSSQRVGGGITKEFKSVKHKYPMLSLSNTYSEAELTEFDNRIKKAIANDYDYVCELKYDGVAIGLTYIKGQLTQAVTRGDGVQGDDVSNNVKTIKSIPLKLRGQDYPDEFGRTGNNCKYTKVNHKLN